VPPKSRWFNEFNRRHGSEREPMGSTKAGDDLVGALSIVIPTLEAGAALRQSLPALAEGRGLVRQIIIADGGSRDDSRDVAAVHGARVVPSSPGRGRQLAAGAAAADGAWLLFLHADTVPTPGWPERVAGFIADPANEMRAGYFRLRLDDAAPAARRLERLVAWRCRRLALPYGDQGLLMSRRFYATLGGFRALPLMEDVDLVRRIGRERLVLIEHDAVTSAARYRRDGYLARSLRNLACLGLYYLGLPPRVIVRLYA
jgi:rSAM/selenodomain-associated transferase 2